MFDDVIGHRRGREEAGIVSARTYATMALRKLNILAGASFASDQPTIAEISLKCPLHVSNGIHVRYI